jgi:hypothetical protein
VAFVLELDVKDRRLPGRDKDGARLTDLTAGLDRVTHAVSPGIMIATTTHAYTRRIEKPPPAE